MKRLILALSVFMLAQIAVADGLLRIEAPQEYSIQQGVTTVRGFAVSDAPVVLIRMMIDGGPWLEVPYGSVRNDAAETYKDKYVHVENSGFSYTISWRKYDPGVEHLMVIQMLTLDGKIVEESTMFTTERFDPLDDWVKYANMGFTEYMAIDNGFVIYNALIGGVLYEQVVFAWDNTTQNFNIVGITGQ